MSAPSYTSGIEERKEFRAQQASTLMFDPDGPEIYVPSLDEMVPTYTDPMEDRVSPHTRGRKRLNYHVPFGKRGIYKPEWLPEKYLEAVGIDSIKVDEDGYVICDGSTKVYGDEYERYLNSSNKWVYRKVAIGIRPCIGRAVNRSGLCRNHGGALHPGNKKLSAQCIAPIPENRVEQLDRVQKFMQGFLKFEDLTDEEVMGGFICNDQGRPIATTKLGDAIHQGLVKELFKRMNHFMALKLPNMLARIAWVAESDVVEPETQLKAAVWMAERVMGKNPEILLTGKAELPYESILTKVEGGSREEYRKQNQLDQAAHLGSTGHAGSMEGVQLGLPAGHGIVVDAAGNSVVGDFGTDLSGEDEPDDEDDSGIDGDSGPDDAIGPDDSGVPGMEFRQQPGPDGENGAATDGNESDSGGYTGIVDSVSARSGMGIGIGNQVGNPTGAYGRQNDAEKRVADAKAFRDRIKGQRNKRFAARATGAESINEISWQVEFKQIVNKVQVEAFGRRGYLRIFRAKLVPPEVLTEARLARIQAKEASASVSD